MIQKICCASPVLASEHCSSLLSLTSFALRGLDVEAPRKGGYLRVQSLQLSSIFNLIKNYLICLKILIKNEGEVEEQSEVRCRPR
jgi:hypothetical protein